MDTETSWLADGVAKIAELTEAAQTVTPSLLSLPLEKAGTYAVVIPGPSGSKIEDRMQRVLAGPAWHRERLESPAQLSAFIKSLKSRDVAPADGIVLVSMEGANYCYSFNDRRDLAFAPLKISTPWRWLEQPTQELDQREVIRTLRITFAGCLPTDSTLVSTFRKLKFNSNGSVDADYQRGNEALGRSLMNQVVGTDNLPEEVTLTLPVFENYPLKVRVRVAIEIDAGAQTFELIAFPNQLEDGRQATLEAIRAEVQQGTEVPSFIGRNDAK